MNTIGIGPDDGATTPLALKVMVTMLPWSNVTVNEVAGIGTNAPDGSEYVAEADSVNANTCLIVSAAVVGILPHPLPRGSWLSSINDPKQRRCQEAGGLPLFTELTRRVILGNSSEALDMKRGPRGSSFGPLLASRFGSEAG
jgi:hypothetical protein